MTIDQNKKEIYDDVIAGIIKCLDNIAWEIWIMHEGDKLVFICILNPEISPMVARHVSLAGYSMYLVGRNAMEKFPGTKIEVDYGVEAQDCVQKLRASDRTLLWHDGSKLY